MDGESFNSYSNNESQRDEWRKIAQQIASHTTTDGHGESVYLGRELPEEMRGQVEEVGFEQGTETPRGSSEIDIISRDTYPRCEGESEEEYEQRISKLQEITDKYVENEERKCIDEFWSKHKNLLAEAIEMKAPLKSEEFKERGYKFAEYKDGSLHIWAPTPEYREWLDDDSAVNVVRQQEQIIDKWVTEETISKGETFRGKKYEDLGEMKERIEIEEGIRKDICRQVSIGYSKYLDLDEEDYNPNDYIFNNVLVPPLYKDSPLASTKERIIKSIRREYFAASKKDQEEFFVDEEREAFLTKITNGDFRIDDAKLRKRVNEIFEVERDENLISDVLNGAWSGGVEYDKYIETFKLKEWDPLKLLDIDAQRHYGNMGRHGDWDDGRRAAYWGTRVQVDGELGQEWSKGGIICYMANDGEWKEKLQNGIKNEVAGLSKRIKETWDGTKTVSIEDGGTDINGFDIISWGAEPEKTMRIPMKESILNHMTEERLVIELAKLGIKAEAY